MFCFIILKLIFSPIVKAVIAESTQFSTFFSISSFRQLGYKIPAIFLPSTSKSFPSWVNNFSNFFLELSFSSFSLDEDSFVLDELSLFILVLFLELFASDKYLSTADIISISFFNPPSKSKSLSFNLFIIVFLIIFLAFSISFGSFFNFISSAT